MRRAYCLDAACTNVPGTCIQGNPFKGGTRMLVASYALSQVKLRVAQHECNCLVAASTCFGRWLPVCDITCTVTQILRRLG
jgi:hypothetical protein